MRFVFLTLALAAPLSAAHAQISPPSAFQLDQSAPQSGSWTYSTQAGVSDAVFMDARGQARVRLRCTRNLRRVSISTFAPAATGVLTVLTSSGQRSLAARFEAMQILADVPAMDAVLDALAFSRGRFALLVAGGGPLVVPTAPELGRIVEDCRS